MRNAIVGNVTSGVVSNAGRRSPNLLLYSNYCIEVSQTPVFHGGRFFVVEVVFRKSHTKHPAVVQSTMMFYLETG